MIDQADELLTVLQADAALQGFLGEYVFNDGLTAPALVVLAANEQLPSLDRITGVECVISRTPETKTRVLYSCSILEKEWRIYLVEYDGASANDLVSAADRICELFPGSSYSVLYSNQGSPEIAGKQQCVMKVPPHAIPSGSSAVQINQEGTLLIDGGSSCD